MLTCPICNAAQSRVVCDCSNVQPRLNTLAGFIHECKNCGFMFKQTTDQSLDELEEIYQYSVEETSVYFGPTLKGYSEENVEIRLYTRTLQELRRRLGPPGNKEQRLLDVGCGTGALLDLSRKFSFSPYGVELNPHFARYAQDEFSITVVAGELSVDDYGPGFFDAITMMDLIEHVPDPLAVLDTARQLLRPGGMLVVYTPNHRSVIARASLLMQRATGGRVSTPAYTVFGTNHISFFDHRTLPRALKQSGYTVNVVHPIKYDTRHQGEVNGQSLMAMGINVVETISQVVGLPYRLLAFATKPA